MSNLKFLNSNNSIYIFRKIFNSAMHLICNLKFIIKMNMFFMELHNELQLGTEKPGR